MGRTDNDQKKSIELFYDLTVKQLENWGVKYHELFLGKPAGDVYVDDKGMHDNFFFDQINISKARMHFNEFMINFHDFRHSNKKKMKDNSIESFVKNLKKKSQSYLPR